MSAYATTANHLANTLDLHRHPGEVLHLFGDAWFVCSCGQKFDLTVTDNKIDGSETASIWYAHVVDALMPSMADAWDSGYMKCSADFEHYHNGGEVSNDPLSANPYRNQL